VISLLRRKETQVAPTRDFLEEHERRAKQGSKPPGQAPQLPQAQQPATSIIPHMHAPAQKQRDLPARFEVLLQELRELGFDVKPLEMLKEYAKRLDEEERRLIAEIESKQKTLELVRRAREALRNLGA